MKGRNALDLVGRWMSVYTLVVSREMKLEVGNGTGHWRSHSTVPIYPCLSVDIVNAWRWTPSQASLAPWFIR